MLKNITNLKIMNEDLHVFIHQDFNPLGKSEYTPNLHSSKF